MKVSDPTEARQVESSGRRYRMAARRESMEDTRRKILGVTHELWLERHYDGVSVEAVAGRAGVSRQTVYRHFGSKQGLVTAAAEWASARERVARGVAPGDVTGAVERLVERYEEMGDANIRALELEDRVPEMAETMDRARRSHREWLEEVFAPCLVGLRGLEREEAVLALYAATDVMQWKLLRRDLGLSCRQAEAVLLRLVRGVLGDRGEKEE